MKTAEREEVRTACATPLDERFSLGGITLILIAVLTLIRSISVVVSVQGSDTNVWTFMYSLVYPDAPARPVLSDIPPLTMIVSDGMARFTAYGTWSWATSAYNYFLQSCLKVPFMETTAKALIGMYEEIATRPGLCFIIRLKTVLAFILLLIEARTARALFYRFGKFHARYFILLSSLNPIAFGLTMNPDEYSLIYMGVLLVFNSWFRLNYLFCIFVCIALTPIIPAFGVLAMVLCICHLTSSSNKGSDTAMIALSTAVYAFILYYIGPPLYMDEYPIVTLVKSIGWIHAYEKLLYYLSKSLDSAPISFDIPSNIHDMALTNIGLSSLFFIFTLVSTYKFIKLLGIVLINMGNDKQDNAFTNAISRFAGYHYNQYIQEHEVPKRKQVTGILCSFSNMSHRYIIIKTALTVVLIALMSEPPSYIYRQLTVFLVAIMLFASTFQLASCHFERFPTRFDVEKTDTTMRAMMRFTYNEFIFLLNCVYIYLTVASRFIAVLYYKHYFGLVIYFNQYLALESYKIHYRNVGVPTMCIARNMMETNILNPFIFDSNAELMIIDKTGSTYPYTEISTKIVDESKVQSECSTVLAIIDEDKKIGQITSEYIHKKDAPFEGSFMMNTCSPVFDSGLLYKIRDYSIETNILNSQNYEFLMFQREPADLKLACVWMNRDSVSAKQ